MEIVQSLTYYYTATPQDKGLKRVCAYFSDSKCGSSFCDKKSSKYLLFLTKRVVINITDKTCGISKLFTTVNTRLATLLSGKGQNRSNMKKVTG